MLARHRVSVPWLLVILLVACLGPVLVHGAVAPGSEDDSVRLANAANERATTTAAPQGVEVTTTVPRSGKGRGNTGDDERDTTTASSSATTTTTTAASGEATTTTASPGSTPTTARPGGSATTTTAAPAAPSAIDEVLALVNEARAAASPACPPLTVDAALARAAQVHSDDMAARDYLDHLTPEGQDPKARAEAQGYKGTAVGENIAQGYPDPASVMTAWMGSEGHKANIVNCSYTVIGIGVNGDGWYWTEVFGL